VKPEMDMRQVRAFCRSSWAAPAIALYTPSKRVLFCKSFVDNQQKHWRKALSQSARVFVIGLRVHSIDHHIWQPLAESKCPIFYVGREPEDFATWAHVSGKKHARPIAQSFGEALPVISEILGKPYYSY